MRLADIGIEGGPETGVCQPNPSFTVGHGAGGVGEKVRNLQGLCGDAEPCSLLEFCKAGGASRLWMELDKVEALRSFWSSF